jgi:hypothetical protein
MKNPQNTKCKAITRDGRPCPKTPMNGSCYCWWHSFGRFKDVPVRKNPTVYSIVITIVFGAVAILISIQSATKKQVEDIRNTVATKNDVEEVRSEVNNIEQQVRNLCLEISGQKDKELIEKLLQDHTTSVEVSLAHMAYNMKQINICKWLTHLILEKTSDNLYALALRKRLNKPDDFEVTEEVRIIKKCLETKEIWLENRKVEAINILLEVFWENPMNPYVYVIKESLKKSRKETTRAVTYYVDWMFGEDSAAGINEMPFKTLLKSLFIASPGDTIVLRGGQYHVVDLRKNIFIATIPSSIDELNEIAKRTKMGEYLVPASGFYGLSLITENRKQDEDLRTTEIMLRIPGPWKNLDILMLHSRPNEVWLLRPGRYTWSIKELEGINIVVE